MLSLHRGCYEKSCNEYGMNDYFKLGIMIDTLVSFHLVNQRRPVGPNSVEPNNVYEVVMTCRTIIHSTV